MISVPTREKQVEDPPSIFKKTADFSRGLKPVLKCSYIAAIKQINKDLKKIH